MYRIRLRWLILSAMTALSLLIYAVTLHASYRTLRQQLLEQALDANQASATHLAQSADTLLEAAQAQLAYSANLLATGQAHPGEESERLGRQTGTFTSSWVVQADGRVLAGTPPKPASADTLKGTAESEAVMERRQPLIEVMRTAIRRSPSHGRSRPQMAVTKAVSAERWQAVACSMPGQKSGALPMSIC